MGEGRCELPEATPRSASASVVYVTCVDPKRGHPSGRLAEKYLEIGTDVVTLFENARNIFAIFRDASVLWRHTAGRNIKAAIINLNGSVAQLVAVFVLRLQGIPTSVWIMDSYPGCLRYVSKAWWVFWPVFFISSWMVKALAKAVFVIDEGFLGHAPRNSAAVARTHYIPLPVPIPSIPNRLPRQSENPLVMGILGNIEQIWLDQRLASLVEMGRVRGFRILIATSEDVRLPDISSDNLDVVMPWPKEQTENVFETCDYLLVPLSADRLTYSSPSKILESYSRGLQPIIDSDYPVWIHNNNRRVYQRCIHFKDFLAGDQAYSIEELRTFASHWTGQWEEVIERTLALSLGCGDRPLN